MFREEKKIIANKNMDMPPKSVLDKAKQSMKGEGGKKKLSWKKGIAIATPIISIVFVLSTIPAWFPSEYDDPRQYIYNDSLISVNVSSTSMEVIDWQSAIHFEEYDSVTMHAYNDQLVMLEQFATLNGAKIRLLIDLSFAQYEYEKIENYDLGTYKNITEINGVEIGYEYVDEKLFIRFYDGKRIYRMIFEDKCDDWKNIIETLLLKNKSLS